eukprot:TRINITY_DN31525_c0_g1_i1.p3 TRINITY_DN31525_c0_g1~~TRINITY_DN31525_c0_g1_i1.p3  ORF type:complete len:169 (-),score=14.08 TRINITY_DN31525_c0_g1_i1:174-680(-)
MAMICLFGVCIPLDIIVPVLLGWLHYIGVDLLFFLPQSWKEWARPREPVSEAANTEDGEAADDEEEDARLDASPTSRCHGPGHSCHQRQGIRPDVATLHTSGAPDKQSSHFGGFAVENSCVEAQAHCGLDLDIETTPHAFCATSQGRALGRLRGTQRRSRDALRTTAG